MRTRLVPFEQASTQAQVRRLRAVAVTALQRYALSVQGLALINHGENTTFRAVTDSGQRLLVRVHRHQYHTRSAILEELRWLRSLERQPLFQSPAPLADKSGQLVVQATALGLEAPRYCSVFQWIDGRLLSRSLRPVHLVRLGRLLATLHGQSRRRKVQHRNYWNAEGLLGKHPTFGPIDAAPMNAKQRTALNAARRQMLAELRSFQRRFPERMGLIHADPHFGNLLSTPQGLALIDFDDCGYGFHMYDLGVVLLSLQFRADRGRLDDYPRHRAALLEGYAQVRSLDEHDERLCDRMTQVRHLCMLGWLASRSDNPRLASHLPGHIQELTKMLRS